MKKQLLHDMVAVLKVLAARLRFLSVFLIAALVVGYWDNIKNHWDKWTRPVAAPDSLAAAPASDIEYYCAMHPNIVRSQPGNCPICGMPLIKRKKGEQLLLPRDVLARVQLSPQRVALAGIQTAAVQPRALVREIHAVGVLDYDETKVAQFSTRVAGRADTLYITYTGQAVKQGDPVYSIYSPEVYTAQREYLLARKRVNDLAADAPPEAREDAAAVYNSSMQKLVLWGISREELDQMDKEYDQTGKVPTHLTVTSPISGIAIRKDIFEGAYVQAGDKPYTIADLDTLWLQAKIYERDVPLVQIGQPVLVSVEAFPNQPFPGTVTFRAFQIDPQTRTLDARIEVRNPDLRLRPGMFADASIRVPVMPERMAPADALTVAPTDQAAQNAKVYQSALAPYVQAHQLLTRDKAHGVVELLERMLGTLKTLQGDEQVQSAYRSLQATVQEAQREDGDNLEAVRKSFRTISTALIEIGKSVGMPAEAATVQIFRCPMTQATWLQSAGETANPYYGQSMLTCGAAVEGLPKIAEAAGPSTQPAGDAVSVLAVPRSAVIDTGRHQIVYVESSPGVFDMRAVRLGVPAGDYYPVFSGLREGERVATNGAFLIDAENRLNPGQVEQAQ